MSRLPDRASHVFFLRRFAAEKQPGKGSGTLGDLLTYQVVKEYVRPATAGSKSNFVDCLKAGSLDKKIAAGLDWCPNGVLTEAPGRPQAFGATTYFASHAWSYRFNEFVSMLEGHYNAHPKTQGGTEYAPIYYWVDILAVTQHFTGDFKDHPDSDFPGVIRASQAVLFTMHPWRSPIAPTRVWCLFEALTAVQAKGVGFDVILDTGNSKDTNTSTLMAIANSIDARSANATVASDKAYILGCIKAGLGVEAFNAVLRSNLRAALSGVMVNKALDETDTAALMALVKVGACTGPNGVLDLPRYLAHASAAEVASVVDALGGGSSPMPRGLVLSGRTRGMQKLRRLTVEEDGTGKTLGELPHHRGACPENLSCSDMIIGIPKGDGPVWTYMPLPASVLAAVGRLLSRQRATSATTAAARTGGGGGDAADGGCGGALAELWLCLGPPAAENEEAGGGGGGGGGADKGGGGSSRARANASPGRTAVPRLPPANVRHLRGAAGASAAATSSAPSSPMRSGAAGGGRGGAAAASSAGGGGGRATLWAGLRSCGTLRLLCLQACVLTPADVDSLAAALHENSVLRVLQVWDFIPPPGAAVGVCAALIRGLLLAGLSSRTLTHLHIVPSRVCWIPGLPELAAAVEGAAQSALKELVLAPVALGPPAVRQLAEVLAALPELSSGTVDALKPPPRTWMPAPTPEERGQWWHERCPIPPAKAVLAGHSGPPPNHIYLKKFSEERVCSPGLVPTDPGVPADIVGELRALLEVIGSGGGNSGGVPRSGESFLPPLRGGSGNPTAAAASSARGLTDADAAAGPWTPRVAAFAHFIAGCAGLPATKDRGCSYPVSHIGDHDGYKVQMEDGLQAEATARNYTDLLVATQKAAPPEYTSRVERREVLPSSKALAVLSKLLHAAK
ncbi:hypothetical protein HXX76_003192 [Chlamydomonas incerta]|uniref:Uncharacterized protein n=1 Tax=Chlamydomonas incerta TaxID=51695 RepID=A0A835TCJ3_CHLIN|nr:hypothetical protein HXX76_003192 [Chlamydomonas incerta]|eukprot:KAG2441571.1 hypothetical protein HXX76_003192 [Chlamydomonas incerta]